MMGSRVDMGRRAFVMVAAVAAAALCWIALVSTPTSAAMSWSKVSTRQIRSSVDIIPSLRSHVPQLSTNGVSSRSLLVDASVSTIASANTIPEVPSLPREYAYLFNEDYYAVSLNSSHPGVVSNEHTTGSQHWSLRSLSTRGLIGAVDLARFTVTNYSNTASGSLVVDLWDQSCEVDGVEQGSPYAGYDYYQQLLKQAEENGIPVAYEVMADWTHNGVSYGSVRSWAMVITDAELNRKLQYTLLYPLNSNHQVAYIINGTEMLPYEGVDVLVQMRSTNVRVNYTVYDDSYQWPPHFFSTVCPFGCTAAGGGGDKANTAATATATHGFASLIVSLLAMAAGSRVA